MDIEKIVARGFQYFFSFRSTCKAKGFNTFDSKRFDNGFHREKVSLQGQIMLFLVKANAKYLYINGHAILLCHNHCCPA